MNNQDIIAHLDISTNDIELQFEFDFAMCHGSYLYCR